MYKLYLADLMHDHFTYRTVPYAIACVGSYAMGVLGDTLSLRLFRSPDELAAAVIESPPDLMAFMDLVHDEEDPVLVAEVAQCLQPAGGRHDVATLTLHRFDDHGRDNSECAGTDADVVAKLPVVKVVCALFVVFCISGNFILMESIAGKNVLTLCLHLPDQIVFW